MKNVIATIAIASVSFSAAAFEIPTFDAAAWTEANVTGAPSVEVVPVESYFDMSTTGFEHFETSTTGFESVDVGYGVDIEAAEALIESMGFSATQMDALYNATSAQDAYEQGLISTEQYQQINQFEAEQFPTH